MSHNSSPTGPRFPLRLAAAALAVPAALVASCGDDAVEPEGEPLSSDQRAEIASSISSAMTAAGSARQEATMDISVEAGGQSVDMTMDSDGVGETTDSPATQFDLTLQMTGSVSDSFGPITAMSDGDEVFLRSTDAADLEAFTGTSEYSGVESNEWVRLRASEAEAITSSTTQADFAKLLEGTDSADAGTDDVGHRYNLVLTVDELADSGLELNSVSQQSFASLPEDVREELGDTPIMVSLWLDSEDRVVRETLELDLDTSEVTTEMALTIELSDFGVPVPQEMPQKFDSF